MTDPIQGVGAADALSVASTGQSGSSQAPVPSEQPSIGASADSADIAWAEALLATIAQAAASVPPIDQIRVAELQQSIDSGNFQPNSQQIAQKIVEMEALLASRGEKE